MREVAATAQSFVVRLSQRKLSHSTCSVISSVSCSFSSEADEPVLLSLAAFQVDQNVMRDVRGAGRLLTVRHCFISLYGRTASELGAGAET